MANTREEYIEKIVFGVSLPATVHVDADEDYEAIDIIVDSREEMMKYVERMVDEGRLVSVSSN